jgi:hypothetical protein
MGRMLPPSAEGFYWAKWKIAEDGTTDADDGVVAPDKWEVVEVFQNHFNDGEPEQWLASVPGVEKSQSIENFYWGPGPLTPPGRRAE